MIKSTDIKWELYKQHNINEESITSKIKSLNLLQKHEKQSD
jgi:hypothetical protein